MLLSVETIGGLPQIMTVSLGCIADRPPSPAAGQPSSEVVGLLELGVGGLVYTVEVDFVQGVQFSVSATHLRLMALHRGLPGSAFVPGAVPFNASVGAALSVGTIAHGRQPQRTIAKTQVAGVTPALAPATWEGWPIPNFAKSFRVEASPVAAAIGISVENFVFQVSQTNLVAYPSGDIPVPTDGKYLRVTNNSAINNIDEYRCIFDLAI